MFGREEFGLRAMYITTEAYLMERRGERNRHVWREGLKGQSNCRVYAPQHPARLQQRNEGPLIRH